MRLLITLVFPLVLQILAYVVVFAAARGGGSFMGLLAMPVAAVALIVLLAHGISAARRQGPLLSPALVSLAIAVLPPIGLLIFRALER
jgi:hypothetical protein